MAYTTIQLAIDSSVATVTLNRPDKRNAISYELIEDLLAALDEIAKSPAQILILTGAGKAFCSGMDLENLKALTGRSPEQNLKDSETMARLFRSLYDFPKPTIAAVNGAAIAGRLRVSHTLRLYSGCAGSKVWLHRSADWIRARHRLYVSFASNRRETCARFAAHGQNH